MNPQISDHLRNAVDTVVDEHGWVGATTDLIAQSADVNRTTLYRKGLNRQRLLAAAAEAAANDFRSATLEPLTSRGLAASRLEMLLEVLYDVADRHLGLLAGLYDGPTATFHLADSGATQSTRFEYTEPFERLLLDGDADGSLVTEDPHTDAELIFNCAGWSYIHFRRTHGWNSETTRANVTRIVLGSFRPVKSSGHEKRTRPVT